MKDKNTINLTKLEAKKCIEFSSAFVSGYNVRILHDNKQYRFNLDSENLEVFRSWMIPKTASEATYDIKQSLIGRGIGLILVGIAHFIFSKYLSPFWGGILIVAGILSFYIVSPYMFLLHGILLILASALNGLNCITAMSKGAHVFGGVGAGILFQLIWGLEDIVRFLEYSRNETAGSNLSYENRPPAKPGLNISEPEKNADKTGTELSGGCASSKPDTKGSLESSPSVEATLAAVRTSDTSVPEKKSCPICGTEMVLRQFQSGPRNGQQFYGCIPCKKGWPVSPQA